VASNDRDPDKIRLFGERIIRDDPARLAEHERLIQFWRDFHRLEKKLEIVCEEQPKLAAHGLQERPCDGDIDKVIRWWLEWMKINEL
jgi:hypothetical protein